MKRKKQILSLSNLEINSFVTHLVSEQEKINAGAKRSGFGREMVDDEEGVYTAAC